ncbi:hypothetical protein [Streptomyces filamentosus]|uniref:hypothetical protein n=1 Tax=Streptomyces filamentosus TaxID=67294 RepID=UPI0033FB2629
MKQKTATAVPAGTADPVSGLRRLVRAGQERQVAGALRIHSMPPGPERGKELELWALCGAPEVSPAEAVHHLATDPEYADLRATPPAWAGSYPLV